MNRYKSSQKWRKVMAGHYESPHNGEGEYVAIKQSRNHWTLHYCWGEGAFHNTRPTWGPFATLADCQEVAERLSA